MDMNGFLIELSESESTNFGRVDFSAQSEPQKVFSAIWQLESQVNNGGFDQYFLNSEADVIGYAPIALRAIGASSCAEIVDSAIQVIAPLPPTDAGRHEALYDSVCDGLERLELLDAEFFDYPDNLTELLFAFVSQRPETFGPIPSE